MVSTREVYVVVMVISGFLPLLLYPPVARNREKPGATGLLIAIPGVSGYSFGYAFVAAATTPRQLYVALTVTLLVTEVSVIGWFLTAGEYAGAVAPTRRVLGALALFPLSIQVAAWTSPFHHLLYPPLSTVPLDESIRLSLTAHPALLFHTVGSYAIVVAGFLVLVADVVTSRGIRRRQGIALAAGALVPVVPNVLFIAGYTRYQLTPLGFVGTVFVMTWALFRADFLDVVPVGRRRAVESMPDPVVTLDAEGHVVDSNPAARALVGAGPDWEGTPAAAFFEPFPELAERCTAADPLETEISLATDGQRRHFSLDVSPIRGPHGDPRGTLVVLREVTALKERERDLDLLRQVQSRVLRHNLRNDLSVITGYGEMFADEFDGQYGEMAETVVTTANGLASISRKARSVEQLVEDEQTPTTLDVGTMLRGIVEGHRERFPGVTFALDAPGHCELETIPAVELALENLVENAAEHNDAADPTVEVTLSVAAAEAVVTVADDGPGIPEHELAVLDRGEETPLEHGSGVGLWVVDWVVRNSTATVEFETGEGGTTVTVRIPR